MVLEIGNKIHVVQRRSFEADMRRHFIGEVLAVSDVAVRARGHVFVFDRTKNVYLRLPEIRTRIVSLVSSSLIINVLPQNANALKAAYTYNKDNRLMVTDGETFSLDINEFGVKS